MAHSSPVLSVVVPVYNEQAAIAAFHESLLAVLKRLKLSYEIIYCNDGSRDASLSRLRELARDDEAVRVLSLSRNFGKEVALTAGIQTATGQAIIMLDADGQHPVEMLPAFVAQWQAGSQIVIGVRKSPRQANLAKRLGSKLFYRVMNRLGTIEAVPGATDYRLISRDVQQAFNAMPERNRLTRGLIDWLGYDREYVEYEEKARLHGEATYSLKQLAKLFVDSIISTSTSPLYIAAYIGAAIVPLATLLLGFMTVEMVSGDPLNLHITGGAFVLALVLLLIGVLLLSQGIIGIYLSHIHAETKGRPLYIIDETKSVRL